MKTSKASRSKEENDKRRKLTVSDVFERIRHNNNVTLVLIVMGILAVSSFGAYFFEIGINENFESLWDTVWWTIVTLTTVGYGDKYPVTIGGKFVGILMMVLGVATVGIVTGRIASFLAMSPGRPACQAVSPSLTK